MQENKKSNLTQGLVLLQKSFKKNLPATLVDIEHDWNSSTATGASSLKFKELHTLLISLADSAGTYRADKVSPVALELELHLKKFIKEADMKSLHQDELQKLEQLCELLEQVAEEWISSDVAPIRISQGNQYEMKA